MELYCSFQAAMEFELHCSEPSFEDDLYYAELERQILQLTADDDEDIVGDDDGYGSVVLGGKIQQPFSPTKQASSTAMATVGTGFMMWESCRNNNNYRGGCGSNLLQQSWCPSPWQKSNGTGVFIPQTIKSQTNTRASGRMNHGRRMKRQMEYTNYHDQCVSGSSGTNKRERKDDLIINV